MTRDFKESATIDVPTEHASKLQLVAGKFFDLSRNEGFDLLSNATKLSDVGSPKFNTKLLNVRSNHLSKKNLIELFSSMCFDGPKIGHGKCKNDHETSVGGDLRDCQM